MHARVSHLLAANTVQSDRRILLPDLPCQVSTMQITGRFTGHDQDFFHSLFRVQAPDP